MEKQKIKALMMERGIKQKDIAEELGVTRACVSVVINGYENSRRVKKAIASALRVPFDDLWNKDEAS
jgi:DNA-binding XRE family transcriptional regulator